MAERYWVETLGCPKNQVDSDKLSGLLAAQGLEPAEAAEAADLVVVNTCAFIEAARQESVETVLALADARKAGARLVVTGCLAERHGPELREALPEVDLVAGFGEPILAPPRPLVTAGAPSSSARAATPAAATPAAATSADATSVPVTFKPVPAFDLLNLPRPASRAPWAYVKVAEGCDRRCGFCAIPSFRGRQRSRSAEQILDEVRALGPDVREVVLVAQDLASWGLDRSPAGASRSSGRSVSGARRSGRGARRPRPVVDLVRRVSQEVARVRLLYLYPSSLDDELLETVVETGVAYFDLSLQHVSRPLVKRMRRWGDGEKFLERIDRIRALAPDAALRSSFILGYPGETEADHDELLDFLEAAQLDWGGFFTFSEEAGTFAAGLERAVAPELALERLRECAELQDRVTASRRAALVGERLQVLVDTPGAARSHREAPEIDGVVVVPGHLEPGSFHEVTVTAAAGPDVWGAP